MKYVIMERDWNTLSDYERNKLDKLRYKDGELISAIENEGIKKCFVAYGPRGAVKGWAAVYSLCYRNMSCGIFVDRRYRHQGIGRELRNAALKFSINQYGYCYWFKDGSRRILENNQNKLTPV